MLSAPLRALALETKAITDRGESTARGGRVMRIGGDIAESVAGTRVFGPEPLSPTPAAATELLRIEITGETSLDAAQRLVGADDSPVGVLNFASARNPG